MGAMKMQFLTAIAAFLGCLVGLLSSSVSEQAEQYILPFTAGGFIYIATVDVLPDLLKDSNVIQTIYEVIAMGVGVFFMVVITWYE